MDRQIVVCDDEPHVIRAISMKFSRAGFEVKGATDVESCWKLLCRHEAPSFLVIDDLMSSGPDGLELVRRVRNDARLAHVPIVLMTEQSFDLYEYKEQLADHEIALIMTKPFSPRELLSSVRSFIDHEEGAAFEMYEDRYSMAAV